MMATKNITTRLVQVSNVSPRATTEQIRTLFGYLGKIQDLNLYPAGPASEEVDDNAPPKECYIMFEELETVGVALHLNQTSFIDRPLVVAPMHEEIMPDEQTAKTIGTPIQIVPGHPASVMIKQIEKSASKSPGPSPGLLPTPNMPPVSPYSLERPVLSGAPANLNKPNSSLLNKVVTGPAGTVIQTTDPRLTAMGLPQYPPLPANIDPSKIDEIRRTVYVGNLDSAGGVTAEALLQFFNQIGEVKFVRMAGEETQPTRFAFVEFSDVGAVAQALTYNGVMFFNRPLKIHHSNNAIVKPQSKSSEAAQREIEEAMKKVKEAASLMAAVVGDDPPQPPPAQPQPKEESQEEKPKEEKTKSSSRAKSRSRSRSKERRRRKSRSKSRERRRRRSGSRSRDRKRSRERRRSRSRDNGHRRGGGGGGRDRRSRSRSRDRKKDGRKHGRGGSPAPAAPGRSPSPSSPAYRRRRSRSPGGRSGDHRRDASSPPPPPAMRKRGSPLAGSRSPSPKRKEKKRDRSPKKERDRSPRGDKERGKEKEKRRRERRRSPDQQEEEEEEEKRGSHYGTKPDHSGSAPKNIGSKLASLAGLLENVPKKEGGEKKAEKTSSAVGPLDADITATDMDIDSD